MSVQQFCHALILCALICVGVDSRLPADQYIMPTPQKAVYHNAFLPLENAVIVTGNAPSKHISFGIKQLNERITELGGDPLLALKYSEYLRNPVKPPVTIMVGTSRDSFLTQVVPDSSSSSDWKTEEG